MTPKFSPTRSAELLALAERAQDGFLPKLTETIAARRELEHAAPDLAAQHRIAVEVIDELRVALGQIANHVDREFEMLPRKLRHITIEALSLIGE